MRIYGQGLCYEPDLTAAALHTSERTAHVTYGSTTASHITG